MRTPRPPTYRHPIAFGYQVLDDKGPVGVSGASLDDALLVEFAVWVRGTLDLTVDKVLGEELVRGGKITPVPDGFVKMAKHGLVQGGDGLGQRLHSLHLPPPVLGTVVEAISRADAFASNFLGLPSGERGDDLIKGGLGADSVKGGSGAGKIYGGEGNDKAGGGPGNDYFDGGAGNERLSGGEGEDKIHGGEGDDIDLDGDQQFDKIYGEEGNDFELDGDAGNDLLYGGPGDDGGAPTSENLQHRGEGGENRVYGEDGADTMDAQTAVDLAGAREEIFGGDGDDTITAGDGLLEVIDCGPGLDTVVAYDRSHDVLVDCETTADSGVYR